MHCCLDIGAAGRNERSSLYDLLLGMSSDVPLRSAPSDMRGRWTTSCPVLKNLPNLTSSTSTLARIVEFRFLRVTWIHTRMQISGPENTILTCQT